jgi:hypothetical protein
MREFDLFDLVHQVIFPFDNIIMSYKKNVGNEMIDNLALSARPNIKLLGREVAFCTSDLWPPFGPRVESLK